MAEMSTLVIRGCDFITQAPNRIFTVDDFSGDEKLMIETAEAFSRNEVVAIAERLDKQEDGLMQGLIRKTGELGLLGVDAPESYGGLGLGKNLAARILEFLSLNGSFSVTFGVTSGISQIGLALFGTEEQRQKYLPKIVSGEWIGAYCLSEPNSGSDALSATTRADRRDGKWILNGTKMWISNAKWADFFLVMAKIDGEKFSAFLVERDFPGVRIEREEHKMGLKGSSTARVTLENAEVPLENLLYEEGLGHHVAFNALNMGRFKLSSMSIGPAREAITVAAQYALDRKQFGQPIANFGLIQQKFADMASRFFVAESMIYRTGANIDEAFDAFAGTTEGNRKAAEEFAIECSACKVMSTEIEAFIVDEAFQCYGGYGFTEEFPIARIYRDARISRIYEGTNEINRIFLADRYLKKKAAGQAPELKGQGTFISELCAKAGSIQPVGQVQMGALSDLIMLLYADQSVTLAGKQRGGIFEALSAHARNWLNLEAVRAYQRLTGEAVSVPAPEPVSIEEIANAVYQKLGPL